MALPPPKKKLRRDDYPNAENLCEHCWAKCCHYFALPIETPTESRDYDYMRWYLLHERATVFVDEGDWYLMVHTVCKHLQPDKRCGIYDIRPQICRDYSDDELRVRGRLDLRSVLRDAGADLRVRRSSPADETRPGHSQSEAIPAADRRLSVGRERLRVTRPTIVRTRPAHRALHFRHGALLLFFNRVDLFSHSAPSGNA